MAFGHGGARVGAGQKKKALAEKLVNGNPGKRKLEVTEFEKTAELVGIDMPKPREYLTAVQKDGSQTMAKEVYESTWQWLHDRNCTEYIPSQMIEQYAMSFARWVQCENAISEYGFLAKHPTTGNAIPSPFVSMAQNFLKQTNNVWYQIYQIVKENCATEYKGGNPHDDMMERLLSGK